MKPYTSITMDDNLPFVSNLLDGHLLLFYRMRSSYERGHSKLFSIVTFVIGLSSNPVFNDV